LTCLKVLPCDGSRQVLGNGVKLETQPLAKTLHSEISKNPLP